MPPQPLFSLFTPEIRKVFEEYLDNKTELGKTLITAPKRAGYPQYLANPDQKIYQTYQVEKKQVDSIKQ